MAYTFHSLGLSDGKKYNKDQECIAKADSIDRAKAQYPFNPYFFIFVDKAYDGHIL